MYRILLLLTAVFLSSAASANCSGPSAFDALPMDDQAELRASIKDVPYASGLLWQVEKNGVTSYLIGTLHYPDPRHDQLVDTVAPLMAQTRHLFLEITKEKEIAFQRRLTRDPSNYLITEGPSLIERLGEENWQVILEKLKPLGIPGFSVSRQQPWFLGLTLSIPPCAVATMRDGQPGLDRLLENQAEGAGMSTSSLDTIDGLIDALASDPLEEQIAQMRDAIEAGLLAADFDPATTIDLYFNQDVHLIWAFTEYKGRRVASENGSDAQIVATQMSAMEERLVVERNESWLQTLVAELAETPSTVAVGALHLPGEHGLLAGLERAGFSVRNVPVNLQ